MRALLTLAAAEGEPATADALAASQGLPSKFLGSILNDLRRAGIVASQRGAEGGYRLARPANSITFADVMRALDGPLAEVRGLRPGGDAVRRSRRASARRLGRGPREPAKRSRAHHPRRRGAGSASAQRREADGRSGRLAPSLSRMPAVPRLLPDLVQELHDLAHEALGAEAQLEDRGGLNQPSGRQLLDQVRSVAERVDEVGVMPDHERRRGDRPALLDGRGDGSYEKTVEHGRRLLGLEQQIGARNPSITQLDVRGRRLGNSPRRPTSRAA